MDAPIKIFEQALDHIKDWIKSDSFFWKSFTSTGLVRNDLVNLNLIEVPENSGFYHKVNQREFQLGSIFLDAFSEYITGIETEGMPQLMAELFLLHELKHIEQNQDSDRYRATGTSIVSVNRELDYTADAFAVESTYRMRRSGEDLNLDLLKQILVAQVQGGLLFEYLSCEQKTLPLRQLSGKRMRRQLVWLFQLARAQQFNPDALFEDFHLTAPVSAWLRDNPELVGNAETDDVCDTGFYTRKLSSWIEP